MQDLAGHNNSGLTIVPIPNGLPNNGGENTTVLETQRTVFPVVEEVPSETNPRVDQPSIGATKAEMSNMQDTLSSVNNPPNPIGVTQDISPLLGNIQGDADDEGVDENVPLTS